MHSGAGFAAFIVIVRLPFTMRDYFATIQNGSRCSRRCLGDDALHRLDVLGELLGQRVAAAAGHKVLHLTWRPDLLVATVPSGKPLVGIKFTDVRFA